MVTSFNSRKGQVINLSDDFNKIANGFNEQFSLLLREPDKVLNNQNPIDEKDVKYAFNWGLSYITIGCNDMDGYCIRRHTIERDIFLVAYDTLCMLRDYISDEKVLQTNLELGNILWLPDIKDYIHFPDADVELKREALLEYQLAVDWDFYHILRLCELVRNKISLYKRYINANHV